MSLHWYYLQLQTATNKIPKSQYTETLINKFSQFGVPFNHSNSSVVMVLVLPHLTYEHISNHKHDKLAIYLATERYIEMTFHIGFNS